MTGLWRRGSLTLWVSDEATAAWRAAPRKTPGGQARYSETAIETAVMVRLVFHQPPRQAEGLLGSPLEVMWIDLPIPDHTTISRRAALPQRRGSGHRGRHRRPGPQPNTRPGTPRLRSRRLINSGEWGLCFLFLLRATRHQPCLDATTPQRRQTRVIASHNPPWSPRQSPC
ncbi:transposase [Skermanella stibiiresistens]|uniref:transposase n=1 Tax=Skermanella stibiiresistens TaxID=913326 RepID=UPI000A02CC38